MAQVTLINELARRFAGGDTTLEIEASTVRELIRALDERFPGIGEVIKHQMAIAVDGQIFHDALLVPLRRDSEVFFLQALRGG